MKRGLAIGGLVALAGAVAAWTGVTLLGATATTATTSAPAVSKVVPEPQAAATDLPGNDTPGDDTVVTEQEGPVDAGLTPMAQRVAVIGLLNKRNGVSRDITMKPGQALRVGDVIVRLRACEQTAPWENEHLTGAFVQLDVQTVERTWKRAFSGWLYKERPALNVVLHPVYDVWTKSCAMTFPGTPAAPGATPTAASSAKKSAPAPASAPTGNVAASSDDESAAPSNAM